ncbi:MAG TPA: hypothetical protein VFT32_00745, partial [Candidatus Eisenbacteria bacterium]|nr:hypothetical protein [Candidatus Eisenbacteria bacterium]
MKAVGRNSRRLGFVLIIVLALLATLVLVGTAFLVLSSLDRDAAGNYRLTIQARLIARAGVEHAVSRLSSAQSLSSALVDGGDWRYFGNDGSGFEPSQRDVSLATAKRPSYALIGDEGKAVQVRLKYDDKRILSVGLSGRMKGGEYSENGNIYSVEVRDLSGSIFVNDGLKMQGGNHSSVSENLRRLLNVLGRDESIGVAGLGDLILANRPAPGGYPTWSHLAAVIREKGGARDEILDRIERCLTVHGWADTNVVNPVPFGPASAKLYPVKYERGDLRIFRRGPGKDHRNRVPTGSNELGWVDGRTDSPAVPGTTAAVYGQDELFPSYVEVVHRAPVNINTASEPVLVALIADLRGVFLMEKRTSAPLNYGPDDIPYEASEWVVKGQSFEVPKSNYTWEYMGHTYSPEKWSSPGAISESKPWSDSSGATTHVPGEQDGPGLADHDELGRLTATVAFNPSGLGKGASARAVANEIMMCREARGDYATLPFGGPFKTWAQFHAFCDHLARTSVLADDRFTEEHRRRQGAQALADVLKANFNPNFTPNEINPDRNLYLMVDKTDLIVNSTEFCFLPTGYFQINSIGRILREDSDGGSGSKVYDVAAMAGARAVVQVHELYRETTQRQFYRGDSPLAKFAVTNNGHTVESGPESDNGPLLYGDHFHHGKQKLTRELDGDAGYKERGEQIESGWGYEASGYLALPTRGGPGEAKRKFTIVSTQPATQGKDPADGGLSDEPRMHAHFRYDDRLHWNQSSKVQAASGGDSRSFIENAASVLMSGSRQIIVRKVVYNPATCSTVIVEKFIEVAAVEKATNFPDPGEEMSGEKNSPVFSPYDPTDGIRYRLVRSFRLPLEGSAKTRPALTPVAPSDLRVDGMYVERHSGLAYWIDEEGSSSTPPGSSPAYSFDTRKGVAAFWFKPGFDPRFSGKIRTIASVARYHRANYHYRNPSPFSLYYFPAFPASESDTSAVRTFCSGAWPAIPPPDPSKGYDPLHDYLPIAGKTTNCRGLTQIARASLVFHVAWGSFAGMGWDMEMNAGMSGAIGQNVKGEVSAPPPATYMERYGATPTLNTNYNRFDASDADELRSRHWTHIAMIWDLLPPTLAAANSHQPVLSVAINGRLPANSGNLAPSGTWKKYGGLMAPERANFAVHSFWDHADPEDPRWFMGSEDSPTDKAMVNVFRLGEVSTHSFAPFPRNFSSDGTYDEFYMFTRPANGLAGLVKPMFNRGRYAHFGGPGSTEESRWSSPPLRLEAATVRTLAKGSNSDPTGSTATSPPPDTEMMPRLLGVSWTWYAERYAAEGAQRMQ